MKQTFRIIFISCIAGFALPAFAAEQPITDVGTLDETSAKEAFPSKPPYSPYAGTQLSDAPVLRRYARPYVVLDGCGGVRMPTGTGRRISLREGRGSHGFQWPAREARRAHSISSL